MTGYIVGEEASYDLDAIWEYIAQDSIDAADRWTSKLFAAFDLIASNPAIGHKRTDLTAYPILFWPVGAYLILYRIAPATVEVVAVTQGSRDIPSFLQQRLNP